MNQRKITIIECSNGWFVSIEEWIVEKQDWDCPRFGAVYQDLGVMLDAIKDEFKVHTDMEKK